METNELWKAHFINPILDTMAEGVFTLDSRGVITSWNKAMEKISGYSVTQAIGQGCTLLKCSVCYGKECPADIKKCGVLTQGKTETRECDILHRDGHKVPVVRNARLATTPEGQVLGVVETVTDMTELIEIRQKAEAAQKKLEKTYRMGNIIGKSSAMQDVFGAIRAASKSRANILIQGESGTGKELVANAIHLNGPEPDSPMVTVNCSALSESLLESELFGHIKGAFTGAHRDRMGRFEEADNGTIFLDEIGELTPYIQVKLLRVLQEREIERVGDSQKRKINIRIITATHKNLPELTQNGEFREDLFYRLKVFPIDVPPLRERREDIPLLVKHFIEKGNLRDNKKVLNIRPEGMKRIMEYHWPGNIRELENAIEHAFVLCDADQIELSHLPREIITPSPVKSPSNASVPGAYRAPAQPPVTREQLVQLLKDCYWNKAEVGRRINRSRTTVWKYMKKWNVPLTPEEL